MEAPENRKWMDRRKEGGYVTDEFIAGVIEFVQFASREDVYQRQLDPKMRCPCRKCKCRQWHYGDDVMVHLHEQGFMRNYYYWTKHGESLPPSPPVMVEDAYYGIGDGREEFNLLEQMIMDHAGPEVGQAIQQDGLMGFQDLEGDAMEGDATRRKKYILELALLENTSSSS